MFGVKIETLDSTTILEKNDLTKEQYNQLLNNLITGSKCPEKFEYLSQTKQALKVNNTFWNTFTSVLRAFASDLSNLSQRVRNPENYAIEQRIERKDTLPIYKYLKDNGVERQLQNEGIYKITFHFEEKNSSSAVQKTSVYKLDVDRPFPIICQ